MTNESKHRNTAFVEKMVRLPWKEYQPWDGLELSLDKKLIICIL